MNNLLNQVVSLSKEVGEFIRQESLVFDTSKIQKKGFNDLVSYVDKEAEQQLVKGLKALLPKAGFIAEEGTSNHQEEEYNWIVDPLDGTTNFTHGLPVYAISIALMKKQEIVLGVVFEINRQECFYSLKGEKAFCNEQEIKISQISKLEDSLLATGFPYYNFDEMDKYLKILNQFMQTTHGLRRMGSAAVDLAYVACGRFEGFFEYNLNSWDVAAGAFIVQQAGGIVTDFSGGNNFVFGRQIVAASAIHQQMINSIQKYW
ncbi:MAG: inositol monophosphatase [Cyclobacteriaceae bacterium]|nr:inositol monophosphatase [Cyclobacteriaceae bacterium]